MSKQSFHNLLTLEEEAENLGKRAMELGLISSFSLHFFPDCWQFSLLNERKLELLTPEEAYLRFKKLVEQSGQ